MLRSGAPRSSARITISQQPIAPELALFCTVRVLEKAPLLTNGGRGFSSALKIMIADDHSEVRILLRNILESVPEWKVCGEAENGLSAVMLSGKLHPDVVVMDLQMPEVNGF